MLNSLAFRTLLAVALLAALAAPVDAQRSRGGGEDPAVEAAAKMYASRASASEVARELGSRFRVDEARTVEILKTVGFASPAIARAAGEVLSADGPTAARLMARSRMDATEIATGLSRGLRVTGIEALKAMDAAGISGLERAEVLRALRADAEETAAFMSDKGMDVREAAASIGEVHRLSGSALAASLVKGYDAVQVAAWLKDDLRYDGSRIRLALADAGLARSVIDGAISGVGLAPQPPGNLRWWIRDYGYDAGSGDLIENAQIVDRSAVLQGAGGTDGTVWIEGDNLNHPEVEVWAGTTGPAPVKAEIRSRESVGSVDRLEVFFPEMPAPGFRVVTPGGEAEVGSQAWPVGYAAVERELFETALEGLDISIDTDDGVRIAFGSMLLTGELDATRENGIETRVTDVNSSGFTVTTESEPGGAALVLTIPFEESGREFQGHFFAYIPCWTCGSYRIPRAECTSLSITCFTSFLGSAAESLGSCLNPANWSEQELLDTEGIPFTGDLTDTSLSVRMAMRADANGLASAGTTFDFQGNVSIATGAGEVSHQIVDDYVRSRIVGQLTASMGEIDLASELIAALNQYAAVMGWGPYLSVQPMPNGRLFVSFPG